MSLVEIKIKVPSNLIEILSDYLLEQDGIFSVVIEDANINTSKEQQIFHESSSIKFWEDSIVSILCDKNIDIDNIINNAFIHINYTHPDDYQTIEVPDEDWVKKNQGQFKPIKISDKLWIFPSWEDIISSDSINIILNPGLAFGTGSHPTTKLCLQSLEQISLIDKKVLDYGCGSGILTIAAKKLNAAYAVGVDIDEQAILASKDNALKNNIEANFFIVDAFTSNDVFDVVVANILKNPLMFLAELLSKYTKKDGYLFLSGILKEQEEEVKEKYSSWVDFLPSKYCENWVLIKAVKR